MRPFGYGFVILLMTMAVSDAQELQSFQTCQECHAQSVLDWKTSSHARSTAEVNPFYRAMLQRARRADKADDCDRCHQPVTALGLNDFDARKLKNEGVTCDVCHAARVVGKGKDARLELVPGNVKFGPYKDAVPVGHQAAYSSTLVSSQFCMTCHGNLQTAHGMSFCSTEDEYRRSSFAQNGVTCQDCHMPSMEGKTAELGKIRAVHSHIFYGGYNSEILRNCASIELTLQKSSDNLQAVIRVTNKTVGHSLPTGSPMRMVVLTVQAFDKEGNLIWQNYGDSPFTDQQAVFMRLLENERGEAPAPPWEAARVRFDQRLKADETRELSYTFPSMQVHHINATLSYLLAPKALLEKLDLLYEPYLTPIVIAAVHQTVD